MRAYTYRRGGREVFFPSGRDSFREENGTVAARDRRRSRVLLKTKCVKGFPVQRDANRVKGFLEIIMYIHIYIYVYYF